MAKLYETQPSSESAVYVADGNWNPEFTFDVLDPEVAIHGVLSFLRERVSAIIENNDDNVTVMLSGGIDSILLAAVVSQIVPHAQAITFAQPGSIQGTDEAKSASRVASQLGLKHKIVAPTNAEYMNTVRSVVGRLDSAEPWEVIAGATLASITNQAPNGLLLSGAGADALLLGGEKLQFSHLDANRTDLWAQKVTDKIRSNFTRHRFIPDFYERIIDNHPDRHIQIWQDLSAVELIQKIHPDLIRGSEWKQDKLILRQAAMTLGIPQEIAFRKKNPMQESGGGLESIISESRNQLSSIYGEKTYSNPLTESIEWTAARLTLLRILDEF